MPKQKPTLIAYYAEGWRYGYLVRQGYKWTRVRRILPKGSNRRPVIKVHTADTKAVIL